MITHSTPEITPMPVTRVAPTVNSVPQAARVAVPLLVALPAARDGLLELLVQLVKEGELGGPVGAAGLALQVDV
jgi:hypothetical protein